MEEEENGKVALGITIDEELLRRLEASDHPDLATGGITRVEPGEERLHCISDQQPGELSLSRSLHWEELIFDISRCQG